MLQKVKAALRVKASGLDNEILDLMDAAILDLGCAGMLDTITLSNANPLVRQAVITYCKMNFGIPQDYDKLKRSYDEQKAQISMRSGLTDWLFDDAED